MDRTPLCLDAATRNRRHVVQSAIALAAVAAVSNYQSSLASRGWCRSDPLVLIDGILVDIFCTAHLTTILRVTGPTEIVVTTPRGVPATLVLGGIGFGCGEHVSFEQSDELQRSGSVVDVEVAVYVPAPDGLEVGVEFAPRVVGILNPDRADGFSNQWITLYTQLATDGLLDLDLSKPSVKRDRKKHFGSKRKLKHRRH